MSAMLLDKSVTGVLVGAGDPPSADERRALGELAALVAAAAGRRPELTVILAGGMAEHLAAFGDVGARPGEVMLGPAAQRGSPAGPLADLLVELALPPADARRALGAGAVALAEVLDRRVDVVEIGYDAGTRVSAVPGVAGGASSFDLAVVPTAGLAPADPDDAVIDRVGQWSTWGADRHRLRDRMRELRIAPWADATGEGVERCGWPPPARRSAGSAEWTPEWDDRPAADLIVATGGAWAVAPAPTVALALADVLRRPGAGQFALDHARILAPLGSIPDADERRAMIARPGRRPARPARHVRHAGRDAPRPERRLGGRPRRGRRLDRARPDARRPRPRRPAARHVRPWPSSSSATGSGSAARGRHFAIDVTGGLGGLVVDLRDVPLRLPDRADLRGELLESWQTSVVSGTDA